MYQDAKTSYHRLTSTALRLREAPAPAPARPSTPAGEANFRPRPATHSVRPSLRSRRSFYSCDGDIDGDSPFF